MVFDNKKGWLISLKIGICALIQEVYQKIDKKRSDNERFIPSLKFGYASGTISALLALSHAAAIFSPFV